MRNDILLMSAVGLVGTNSMALAPISGTVGADLGRTATQIMGASAAFGLATAVAALALAPLIDRFGAARMATVALMTLGCGLAASGLAPSFTWLLFGQVLAGLASGVALPAAYALASEIAPPGREAATLGRVLTGWTIAMVCGVTLSAVLADQVHWRMIYGLTTVVSVALSWWMMQLPNRGGGTVSPPWTALTCPGVLSGLIAQGVLMTSFYGTYSFLGAHGEAQGWTTTQGALPVLAYGIGFGASGLFDPWLDRRGYGGAGPWVFAGSALALAGISLTGSSLVALSLAFLAWGVITHLALGLTVGRLTRAAGSQKGAVLGLNSAVTYLGVVGGAAGFAPVFTWGGLATCAMIAGGGSAVLWAEALSYRLRSPAAQS
ncbi:MFS transporter [Jannaschia pagri]|uniref:MFS transporter n=1 Tax=Jannaschia pagri TaxID=2829797 RepID=A0ABQ4NG54_9RHOB|nr:MULTISPECIES: MFS transporter [unclassified Jannaschia]GIT90483.1 MFS transporter [Jannaschia sp. AI_61]GIT93412.1 MFS transporter [Jannaschia sp. AI_62]